MGDAATYERDGHVATITYNRPEKLNAINAELRRDGMQYALELLLTGDRIDAARAHEIGLAGWVVPRADLLAEARALADRLCQGAPLAVRAVKEMAYRGQTLPWVDAVRMGETM